MLAMHLLGAEQQVIEWQIKEREDFSAGPVMAVCGVRVVHGDGHHGKREIGRYHSRGTAAVNQISPARLTVAAHDPAVFLVTIKTSRPI